MAERGATTATQAVVNAATASLQLGRTDLVELLQEAVQSARDELVRIARDESTEPWQFASTLLAVIVGPLGGAAVQLGDGVIVFREDASEWRWVFWPQHGEFVNTTHFLTDDDAESFLQTQPLPAAVSDIALTTDGLERLVLHYASQSVHKPFFDRMFAPLHEAREPDARTQISSALERFLQSEAVATRTDDDVSLMMATRRT